MAIDHSQTYKRFKLRNIPHILRLNSVNRAVEEIKSSRPRPITSYLDVGCSNGFLTNKVMGMVANPPVAVGIDCNNNNLQQAIASYPTIEFKFADLNLALPLHQKFDFITCLETLEHTGNMSNALSEILKKLSPDGFLLITVPIEIGPIGVFKFLTKNFIFRDKFTEISRDPSIKFKYFKALLRHDRISQFRTDTSKHGWGTHYGFDFRDLEDQLRLQKASFKKFRRFTTMFYVVKGTNK